MALTGKEITVILSLNGVALANTRIKSHDLQTSCDSIETASPTQGVWKEFIAGRAEWSLTVGYLVLATEKVADLLYVRNTFDISVRSGNTTLLTGKALCTAAKQTATVGNLCQGSFSFKGSGALSAV